MKPAAPNELRLLFWETTTACNLRCVHCRAEAAERRTGELTPKQSTALLDDVASFARPVIVLSGGEPLMRKDIFEIARYGTRLGLRVVLATNGTILTREMARELKESGVQRVSVSIDGSDAATHDAFRGVPGAFDAAMNGIALCREAGLPIQVNATIARHNIDQLGGLLELATSVGACALHFFMLVPTGCGKHIADSEMIQASEYERALLWLCEASKTSSVNLKATCAPHYHRVIRQKAKSEDRDVLGSPGGFEAMTRGCLAGSAVCFVSSTGEVYPCGYLPLSAGNVLQSPLSGIWRESPLFASLRDPSLLQGKCGICDYSHVCGGCRARAYAETGNYLAAEPYCIYQPRKS